MSIQHWPESERPRERLLRQGADALSDAELLAIFLRVGVRGKSAVDLARDLLATFEGNLSALCHASLAELSRVSGIGPAKAAQLKASFVLASRALSQEIQTGSLMQSPQAVRDYLRLRMAGLSREIFWVLLLDKQNRLLAMEELARGTIDQATIYPREVCRAALNHHAAAIVLAHNHPSGAASASAADLALTRRLVNALALIDVTVLDHFIIAGQAVVSMAEEGSLPQPVNP